MTDYATTLRQTNTPGSSGSFLADLVRRRIDADPELAQRVAETAARSSAWPTVYVNRDTGRTYTPHHDDERRFVYEDGPWRYGLAKGGEGGGKSVAGIIKDLERLRRGMNGIMVGTDLEHFKKSLWPEFRRWCPWDQVVPSQRRRANVAWEPTQGFTMAFTNGAVLLCGGIDDPASWEGPNVTFAHLDEARRKKTADALKVLDGRVRIAGPHGELPQLYITSTPRKHWLFDYFGPLKTDGPDELAAFKANSLVIDLLTKDNAANLAAGYAEQRAQTLTEAERRVLLEAAWEDINDTERFLTSITWWDACKEDLPPLTTREPIVFVADGAVSGDSFAFVGITRHPQRPGDVAVRLVMEWKPTGGQPLDFIAIQDEIVPVLRQWYTVIFVYDPYQLHQMAQQIEAEAGVWCEPFGQQQPRLIADKQLLDLVMRRGIAHDGNTALRQAIDNADRKASDDRQTLRIVKRSGGLKIDLAVATSMGAAKCLELNL